MMTLDMPSVISISESDWQDAAFSADFNDDALQFLGGFKEIIPTDQCVQKKTKKKRKEINNTKEEVKSKKRKRPARELPDETINEVSRDIGALCKTNGLESWNKFNLPDNILNALLELEFTDPTPIQEAVILPALRDRLDILGAAETGSGKTVAFTIPIISRLLVETRVGNGPRAIVLAPTRELAVQILKTFKVFADHAGFKVVSIVGGLAEQKQIRIMNKQNPEILIVTPGRLWDLMNQPDISSYLSDLTGVQCVAVDEADRMVEHGHFKELSQILNKVKSLSQAAQLGKLQTLVFSATLTYVVPGKDADSNKQTQFKTPSCQEKIKLIMDSTGMRLEHKKVIDLTRAFGTAEKLVETRCNCGNLLEKDICLVYLLKRYEGRTLIFTNSVDASRRLFGILSLLNFTPLMIHANMIQRQRLRSVEKFTTNKNGILLATDVAARGLDIKCIQHVIHYQVPRTAEMYIHRSGRTARASETGLAVLMVDPKDAHLYKKLCRNLNRESDLPVFPIDCEELKSALHRRVKLASDLDTISFRAKKIKMNESWFEKTAREAELDYDDRSSDRVNANIEYNESLSKQSKLKAELKAELNIPLPDVHKINLPKTRFITPEINAMYRKEVSARALDNLHEKIEMADTIKKRNRKKIQTHMVKSIPSKNKK